MRLPGHGGKVGGYAEAPQAVVGGVVPSEQPSCCWSKGCADDVLHCSSEEVKLLAQGRSCGGSGGLDCDRLCVARQAIENVELYPSDAISSIETGCEAGGDDGELAQERLYRWGCWKAVNGLWALLDTDELVDGCGLWCGNGCGMVCCLGCSGSWWLGSAWLGSWCGLVVLM